MAVILLVVRKGLVGAPKAWWLLECSCFLINQVVKYYFTFFLLITFLWAVFQIQIISPIKKRATFINFSQCPEIRNYPNNSCKSKILTNSQYSILCKLIALLVSFLSKLSKNALNILQNGSTINSIMFIGSTIQQISSAL